jgi:hypothetical protein
MTTPLTEQGSAAIAALPGNFSNDVTLNNHKLLLVAPGTSATDGINKAQLDTAVALLAAKGANSDITSLSGLSTALSISQGGTGTNNAAAAVQSLGAAPKPTNSAAVGQLASVAGVSGGGYNLPSGGTWMYFIQLFQSSTATFGTGVGTAVGVAAGGTLVTTGAANYTPYGFVWKLA